MQAAASTLVRGGPAARALPPPLRPLQAAASAMAPRWSAMAQSISTATAKQPTAAKDVTAGAARTAAGAANAASKPTAATAALRNPRHVGGARHRPPGKGPAAAAPNRRSPLDPLAGNWPPPPTQPLGSEVPAAPSIPSAAPPPPAAAATAPPPVAQAPTLDAGSAATSPGASPAPTPLLTSTAAAETTAAAATPSPVFRRALVDTYALVDRLHGPFSKAQAELVARAAQNVLQDEISHLERTLLSKSRQELASLMYAADLKTLRNEIRMLEKNSFTTVKAEMASIERDLISLQQKVRDELQRTGNAMSIELNNHKVHCRETMKIQERRIQSTGNKLQADISQLRTQLEVAKLEILKLSAAGSIAVVLVLLLINRMLG